MSDRNHGEQPTCKKRRASIYNQQLKSFFYTQFFSAFLWAISIFFYRKALIEPKEQQQQQSLWFLKWICAKIQLYCGFWWQLDTRTHIRSYTQLHTLNMKWIGQSNVCTLKKEKKLHLLENYFGIWYGSAIWLSCVSIEHETMLFSISLVVVLSTGWWWSTWTFLLAIHLFPRSI